MAKKTAIVPTREQDYPEWYQQVIKAADLAENSSVRGCMVIKPWGYGIWENIQKDLDKRFKDTGHENIYCPLFIPLSHLEKEAKHVDGFAKECAVVTHHRLVKTEDNRLIPASPLEEPLVVRPTSETIIGESFAGWVQSYRDLPILVNQWANIVRWEMRTRMFLRTTEFLWQEGHTVHATQAEAVEETLKMLKVYQEHVESILAIPVIPGEKSESERFPGAVNTYCIEAMMQDKKALQAGTSHFLGQNFAKAFDIKYLDKEGVIQHGWTTSWGMSTRLIGGLIMTHSDDDGLVLPPKVAPTQIVILPIIHDENDRSKIQEYCEKIEKMLKDKLFNNGNISVKIDNRDLRGGEKSWHWVKKGVPIRLDIGGKECDAGLVTMSRRDKSPQDKVQLSYEEFCGKAPEILEDIQRSLFEKALAYRKENSYEMTNKADFEEFFKKDNNGFVHVYWNGSAEIEAKIKQDYSVTTRCFPLADDSRGTCIFTGEKNARKVIFARAY